MGPVIDALAYRSVKLALQESSECYPGLTGAWLGALLTPQESCECCTGMSQGSAVLALQESWDCCTGLTGILCLLNRPHGSTVIAALALQESC